MAIFDAQMMRVPLARDFYGAGDLQSEISAVSCQCLPGILSTTSLVINY